MNWKLILQLSLFGLVMAFATVFWIPSATEPVFWLVIFIICAYVIARRCSAKHFLTGFMVSIVNSIWITSAHVLFFGTYMANHPEMARMSASMPLADHPGLMMIMMGPFFGAGSGLVLGLFAFIAAKIVRNEASRT